MNIKDSVLPFGKYKGRTLEQVASSSEGLRYLDWFIEFMEEKGFNLSYMLFFDDLKNYVSLPEIKREIEQAILENEMHYETKLEDPIPPKWWEK